MDQTSEYHDPDYPEPSTSGQEQASVLSDHDRIDKIKTIVRREFTNEIQYKHDELDTIDQRVSTARRMLHRLRYAVVSQYYAEHKLQLSNALVQEEVAAQTEPRAKAEVSAILLNEQKRIHPSVKKLLGRNTVDFSEIFKDRSLRNRNKKNYLAMVQLKNYTIAADSSLRSLRPETESDSNNEVSPQLTATEEPSCSRPKKIPRYIAPKIDNVFSLNEVTRNKQKHRYRIIIGNTSKYAPPSSKVDRSTHKWLLYVRGPPSHPDISTTVTSVTVTLHETYAPHHKVHIEKPPFHISRRGWGEFPAKIELHFGLPTMNRPVTLQHTIKLDRNYTGLQTLGAETVVDVWLYSDDEMLKYVYEGDSEQTTTVKEEISEQLPQVPTENEPATEKSWMDFLLPDNNEMDVDEMIIKPVKKEKCEQSVEETTDSVVVKQEYDDILHTLTDSYVNDKIKMESLDDGLVVKQNSDVPTELLSHASPPKKRIMKYMDPITGKIYYLEMDRHLDVSKVQEIIINSKGNTKTAKISPVKTMPNGTKSLKKTTKRGGVSLLKPEVKSLISKNLKNEQQKLLPEVKNDYSHIENDHCYIRTPPFLIKPSLTDDMVLPDETNVERAIELSVASCDNDIVKSEQKLYYNLCKNVAKFSCVRTAVNYLLGKIPLISGSLLMEHFPFVVASDEKYWKLDLIKRRNIEWSRAKLINKILKQHFVHSNQIWRTKQILLFAHLHGYYPIRPEINTLESSNEWSCNDRERLKDYTSDVYSNPSQISSLTIFQDGDFLNQNGVVENHIDLTVNEEYVDVVSLDDDEVKKKGPSPKKGGSLKVLPVDSEDERLRFLFIEKQCAELGIELKNEDVGNGYSYSAVHAVILCAVKKFAEELIRGSFAETVMDAESEKDKLSSVWTCSGASPRPPHVLRAAANSPRLRALSAANLAAPAPAPYAPL